jgi:hypothetical protein
MFKQIFKWVALVPLLALLLLIPTTPVSAADLRGGDSVIIASGDVINDDLYLAARKIVINGTVNGDVFCLGDTTVNGKINGSITIIGVNALINGAVTHSVRVAAGTIEIAGRIGGDLMVAGTSVDLTTAGSIGRDLVFAANRINIDSTIEDRISGYGIGDGTTANLSSRVGGDVRIRTKALTLASSADIRGNLVYESANELNLQPGAQIGGSITHNLPPKTTNTLPLSARIWFKVIAFLMTLVAGGLVIVLVPRRAAAVVAALKRKPWLSLGWGALILFATPLAVIITFITVVGIPVGLISLVIYLIALYLSQVAIALFLGYWIIGRFGQADSRGLLLGSFALGFTLLTLVKLIPFVGPFLWLATVLFGLGAMAVSWRNRAPAQVVEIKPN